MPLPPKSSRSSFRRGSSAAGVLTLLSGLGLLAAGAIYITPRYLQAQPGGPSAIQAAVPAHQQFMDLLAGIIGRSRAVLALHPRRNGPFTDLVFWLEDPDNPGVMDASEIALLSHSRTVQTLTLYRLPPPPEKDSGADSGIPSADSLMDGWDIGVSGFDGRDARPTVFPDPDGPAFPGFLRRHPEVVSTIIGTGLSDLSYSLQPSQITPEADLLEIVLTWDGDSVDGMDTASRWVEVITRPE